MHALLSDRTRSRLRWLAAELAPFPGRGQFALRLTLACAIAIVIGETFQIPSMVMSLVAVLFTVQANIVATRVVFVALTIADVIAIPLYIVLLRYTYDYPMMRIVVTGVLFFSFMFCLRISKIGILLLGPAMVLLYAQSFADLTGDADYLLRQVLWSVVAITYGSVIAVLVNSLFSSANPLRQLQAETHRQLTRAAERLRQLAVGEIRVPPLDAQALQQQSATLQSLATFVQMVNARDYSGNQYTQACVAAVSHAQHLCNTLGGTLATSSRALAHVLGRLSEQLLALDAALAAQSPFQLSWTPGAEERAAMAVLPQAEDLYRTLQSLDQFEAPAAGQPAAKEPLLVPDAFTNPAYVRFALKVLICGMTGYFVFNALQWPGIHTILITSGMVALPGLGTSVRQMTLRFYGALLGSLAALLVFVIAMPYIDTIFGLLLVMVPVIAAGTWITAGSERLAYIGTQGTATFALALLEHFGPSTDLTEIRDRMVGILLGVAICWVVYAFIWPESEGADARSKIAALMRSIASLVRTPLRQSTAAEQTPYAKQHMQCWAALNASSLQIERVRYEPQFKRDALARLASQADALIAASRDLLVAESQVHGHALAAGESPRAIAPTVLEAAGSLRDETAALIELYAERVAKRGDPPLQEQERLRTRAQALASGPDAPPLLADMRRLALCAADLPGWDPLGNAPSPAATNPAPLPPTTRNAP
jgi:multidrug resistance protein MdtO